MALAPIRASGARGLSAACLVMLAAAVVGPSPIARSEEPTHQRPVGQAPAAETRPAAEPQAQTAPETAPRPPRPQERVLTLEDIKELPILKRLEIPLEKGEALLADVKDNTFDYDESAFYWMVDVVSKLPPELLKPDADALPYKILLAMPSSFRGRPVTIRGVHMTVAPFRTPALALQKEVPILYECNIREHPLDEERPIATVITLEDPMTYLRAGDDVRVKGYFYKIRKYKGTKGEGVAPMLIARRLEPEEPAQWTRTGPVSGLGSDQVTLAMMMVVLVVLGAAFFVLRQRTRTKATYAERYPPVHKFRLRRPDRIEPPVRPGPGGEGGGQKP